MRRSVYQSGSVSVTWTTRALQARAGDYSPHRGTVTFTSGQATGDIVLVIADDREEEKLEVSVV